MIDFIIPIIDAYFNGGLALYFFFPVIALAFVATVPVIIREILQWRQIVYDIVATIIDHEWVSNYSGDQQYIYYICGALIIMLTAVFIDLVYTIFRNFWKR